MSIAQTQPPPIDQHGQHDADGPLFDYYPPRHDPQSDPRFSASLSSRSHLQPPENYDARGSPASQYDSINSRRSGYGGPSGTPPSNGGYPDDAQQYEPQPMMDRQSRLPPPQANYSDEDQGPPSPGADDDDFFSQEHGVYEQQYIPPSIGHRSQRGASPPPPPQPLLDHSHLKPGNQAALLSHDRTLELYRENAKKTQDPEVQFEFAVFMIDASKTMPIPVETPGNVMEVERALEKREEMGLQ